MLKKDINPSMVKKEYQALVSLKKKSEVWFIPIILEIISGKKRPKTPKPNHSNPKMKRKILSNITFKFFASICNYLSI